MESRGLKATSGSILSYFYDVTRRKESITIKKTPLASAEPISVPQANSSDQPKTYDSYEQELRELKAKTDEINQQSLASTQRLLELVTQCQDISAKSLGMLYYQEEKINGTEDGLDEIHSNLLESGKNLKKMGKMDCLSCLRPCQNFLCCWKTKKKNDNNIEDDDYEEGHDQHKSTSKWHLPRLRQNGVNLHPGGKKQPEPSFIPRITNDESEAVMEKNIAQTSKDISVLRDQAIDIVNSIKSQQAQLNRWDKKAQCDEEKMAAAVQQTTHLLSSSSKT